MKMTPTQAKSHVSIYSGYPINSLNVSTLEGLSEYYCVSAEIKEDAMRHRFIVNRNTRKIVKITGQPL